MRGGPWAQLTALAALASIGAQPALAAPAPNLVTVKVIAINDFHGALESPKKAVPAPDGKGRTVSVPVGGAAYLASAIDKARAGHPNTLTVAAGDLVGASPLSSALFLDEPSIEALNLMGIEYSAVGNHEFDNGIPGLMRIEHGGCARLGVREPCKLDPVFPGAKYKFLAANIIRKADRSTLFPPYALKSFGTGRNKVTVGIIGLTLHVLPTMVYPPQIAGLDFTDEAAAANALVPALKAQGADTIIVLIHEGALTDKFWYEAGCDGLKGEILPIVAKFDPAIDVVLSSHTHLAYICDVPVPGHARPTLLTSAGNNGMYLTDIVLKIDPRAHKLVSRTAETVLVASDGFSTSKGRIDPSPLYPPYPPRPDVAAIVKQAGDATASIARAPVGHMNGIAKRSSSHDVETVIGDLLADAHLAVLSKLVQGGVDVAFTNAGGIRADLDPAPDGTITFGQLFAVQPFGNVLIVKTMTGAQILMLLDQQFGRDQQSPPTHLLSASSTLRYAYDTSRPRGQRVIHPTIRGVPIDPAKSYHVGMSDFLSNGPENFTAFTLATDTVVGPRDVDALRQYFAGMLVVTPPVADRTTDMTPK